MFGIDVNDLQNKVNYAYSAQPSAGQNQYQTGSLSNPDQTSWMQPSGNTDSTLAVQKPQGPAQPPSSQTNNTGIAGDQNQVAQTRNNQIPPGDGTAISAVNNGWSWQFNPGPNTPSNPYYNNTGFAGGGITPAEAAQTQIPQQNQGPTFGSFTNTPGWDQGKLNDPNKHDPKYDWLRARQSSGSTGGDLSSAIAYYNSHLSNGEQPAKWLGGDKVDFGAGVGPVDVLLGSKAGINQDLWAPINSDSNFTTNPSAPSFGANVNANSNQNITPNQGFNRQARFRMMDPMMRQRLMQNPAFAQVIGQPNYNQQPIGNNNSYQSRIIPPTPGGWGYQTDENGNVIGDTGSAPMPKGPIMFGGFPSMNEWSNDPNRMYPGGGVYDPSTGMTRSPRYGEPQ